MSHYNTIMYQLQTLIHRHDFESLVNNHFGDRYVKNFTCWNQFTVMLYAQVSGKSSLREIQNAFLAQEHKMYHLGLNSVKRSTLSDANQTRDYHIYEQMFYKMLKRCKDVTPKHKFKFKNPLMLLDATVVDLCLSAFPWARFRKRKGAIRLHYQLNLSGEIPSFLVVTDAKQHELKVTRSFFTIVPDSIYCMDKAYIDFNWLYTINNKKAFFVTRAKDNQQYVVTGQHEINKKKSILSDESISLTGILQHEKYPEDLRLIRYFDEESGKTLTFLTNNFSLSASTIANIYKARWQIEVFFKWIKQNLKIKTFLGVSKNAVLTQIWVAMCYFLLLSYIKYQSHYKHPLVYLHKVIKETLLERLNLIDLFNLNDRNLSKIKNTDQQMSLALNF